jgi:hypothetical protein
MNRSFTSQKTAFFSHRRGNLKSYKSCVHIAASVPVTKIVFLLYASLKRHKKTKQTHEYLHGCINGDRNRSVDVVTGYVLDSLGSIQDVGIYSFPLDRVQTGSGVHRASYPMGTSGKAAGT